MAHRIDQGEVVTITRRGVPIGHYVPIDKPFPVSQDEIEPEDDPLPDNDGPIVLGTVTADDGPRWHTLWTSSHLGLQEFLGQID
jgi:antitoxin (DNA-binding transcriptional repressor) of toxin-antitoxin stability system